ncbi:MAG: DMT family transporter [Sulfurovum sp.]|nr:DMT family transporter [Sulfurovum sp.]MCB4744349.1 DMT family transporter [Sulfurovum sp.]MCB4746461.1 DMT family transporter [Sulfurovum sp.]MCB4747227.1 DMT family transporter [Sulfurovum sp.]MCB4749448.1 DMT family transporter [Sulfurovum sp.]
MKEKIKNMDRGILLMLLASLTFAIMGGFAKLLTQQMPALEVTFFRNIFGVVIIAVAIWKTPLKQQGGKPVLLFFRGVMGFLALLAYFYIMGHIPLGEAITYNKTSPLFVAFFAWIFLKEKLHWSAIIALILGFSGIVLIAQPQGGVFDKYDILGIFSGIGAALAYTSIRELRQYYDTRAIVMSFMLLGTLGPLLFMAIGSMYEVPQEWDWIIAPFIMPQKVQWLYIVAVGTSATISQLLMTKAYELTKAGVVGTISYTNIIFGMFIGIVLGDPIPSFLTVLGIILVIMSGLIVALVKEKP